MESDNRLVHKVKGLLRKAGLPRWLHRFGPKRYKFWHHACALLVREYCKLGFRRVKKLFDLLGKVCPSKSALHYTVKKMPLLIWQKLLSLTVPMEANVVAIDSTTFSRSSPSFHYLKRIDRREPYGRPVKLSILVNTRTKKIIAAKFRSKPAHDVKDVEFLIKNCKAKTIVADKGYDSEKVHEHLFYLGIQALIPLRKNAQRGFFRMKAARKFNKRTYNRRQIVESTFSSLKRKFGTSIKCRTARTQRAEIYCRLIMQNLISIKTTDLGRSPC